MNALDLKNSILQLAIQGKLVEQRSEEGNSKELIHKIKNEKKQLIEEGKIKKEKPLLVIKDDEKLFDVPSNWEWIRFGDLGSYRKGPFGSALTKAIFVPKSNEAVKVYEQKNAIQKSVDLGEYYITKEYFESKMKGFELSPGDIIVSCAGTIGETYVMPDNFEKGIINQALMQMKLMPSVDVEYFLMYFDFILKKTARRSSKGSAIKNIPPFEELKNYVVPLPPLEEQKRIVTKIEELMPYLDKYDSAYSEVEELNTKFPEDMQKSILQYAIQGKLVEQRAEEGTAEDLYKQIQTEKKRLIKECIIPKGKALPAIIEDEIPFEIPENWKWVRVGDVFDLIMGQSPEGSSVFEGDNGIEFHQGKVFFGEDYIEKSNKSTNKPAKIAKTNTVLLCVRAPVGILNITDRDICIGRGLCGITTLSSMDPLFVMFFLRAFKYDFIRKATGTTFIAITGEVVKNQLFPLPPLEEQRRIVEKIKELLPHAKKLENNLVK